MLRKPDSAGSLARHFAEWVVSAIAAAPVTTSYALVLCGTRAVEHARPEESGQLLDHVSSNVDNLRTHPALALVGSAMFVDGPLVPNLVAGCVPMGIAEARLGSRNAAAVFVAGHVGATLINAAIIKRGVRIGYYDDAITGSRDVGLSYGALAVRFAAIGTFTDPRAVAVDAIKAGAILALTQPWRMPRDFVATGHVIAAAIGVGCGAAVSLASAYPPSAPDLRSRCREC